MPDVIELQALDMWRLEVKWMMNQNEEQSNQTYEIQVGRTTNMDIVDSVRKKHISPQLLSHYHLVLCFALTVHSLSTDECKQRITGSSSHTGLDLTAPAELCQSLC